jgi:ribulose-bisphosphate carboxylase large chain
MPDRLTITYRLACSEGEDPEEMARGIALEQTVELPEACVAAEILERVVGRVEDVEDEGGAWIARISYSAEAVGGELPQLLNLIFGNISMKWGIRVEAIDWPERVLELLPGPQYGVDGLRRLCEAEESRPLLCAALKPLGLSAHELSGVSRSLALAGVDIVKDDHSLADQSWAPFDQRLALCQQAVTEANDETGGSTLYFPNLTGSHRDLWPRLDLIRRAGCSGVMVSPMILGLDFVRELAQDSELAILGHPALAGSFFATDHGIAPELLLGEIFRLVGCDGVIYPNVGGRFVLGRADCLAINDRLRRPLGDCLPAFPVPGGGIDTRRISEWVDRYGPDTIFLIGTGLYREPDLLAAAKALASELR